MPFFATSFDLRHEAPGFKMRHADATLRCAIMLMPYDADVDTLRRHIVERYLLPIIITPYAAIHTPYCARAIRALLRLLRHCYAFAPLILLTRHAIMLLRWLRHAMPFDSRQISPGYLPRCRHVRCRARLRVRHILIFTLSMSLMLLRWLLLAAITLFAVMLMLLLHYAYATIGITIRHWRCFDTAIIFAADAAMPYAIVAFDVITLILRHILPSYRRLFAAAMPLILLLRYIIFSMTIITRAARFFILRCCYYFATLIYARLAIQILLMLLLSRFRCWHYELLIERHIARLLLLMPFSRRARCQLIGTPFRAFPAPDITPLIPLLLLC